MKNWDKLTWVSLIIIIILIVGAFLGIVTWEWLIIPEKTDYSIQSNIGNEISVIKMYSDVFDFIKWFGVVLLTVGGGILTFFGIKTYSKIDEKVNSKMDKVVTKKIKDALEYDPNLFKHIKDNFDTDQKIKNSDKVLVVYYSSKNENKLDESDKEGLGEFSEIIKKQISLNDFLRDFENYINGYDLIIYSIKNEDTPDRKKEQKFEKDFSNKIGEINKPFVVYCKNFVGDDFKKKINENNGSIFNSPIRLSIDVYNLLKLQKK